MRRLLFCFLVAPSALATLVGSVGCSASAPQSGPEAITTIHTNDASADVVDAAVTVVEAGDAPAPAIPGNRLCLPSPGGCDPDNTTPASLCALAPDGGVYDPSNSDAGLACRVSPAQSVAMNGVGSNVGCSVAGGGMDGASCLYSSDCAAAYECVGSPGVCRHYCCGGNTACTDKQFCDIQALAVATTTRVPVCMPIEHLGCALLDTGSCPTGQTCAVVREDGATGCVEIGSRMAGQDCDTEHCLAGLVCLGSASAAPNTPGARTCYALCHMMPSSCTAPATCQGGLPLFQDPSVGVCR